MNAPPSGTDSEEAGLKRAGPLGAGSEGAGSIERRFIGTR